MPINNKEEEDSIPDYAYLKTSCKREDTERKLEIEEDFYCVSYLSHIIETRMKLNIYID